MGRALRAVYSNLRKAWAKRRYKAHFISKTTNSDDEIYETDTWFDFAFDCGYISPEEHSLLAAECKKNGSMIGAMLNNSKPFLLND